MIRFLFLVGNGIQKMGKHCIKSSKTIVFDGKSWYIIDVTSTGVGHAHSIIMFKRSNVVENTDQIKEVIRPILATMQIQMVECGWHREGSTSILRLAVMREDGSMDIDTCAVISEAVSLALDEADLIAHEYFLEVCSPGAERELYGEEDILNAVGEYVYIKFRNLKGGRDEIYGTLLQVEADHLHIAYMDKAVKRELNVDRDNIAQIRLAVKI